MNVSTSQKIVQNFALLQNKNELQPFQRFFLKKYSKSRGEIIKFTELKLCDPTCNN
jgi:hypothetical protein